MLLPDYFRLCLFFTLNLFIILTLPSIYIYIINSKSSKIKKIINITFYFLFVLLSHTYIFLCTISDEKKLYTTLTQKHKFLNKNIHCKNNKYLRACSWIYFIILLLSLSLYPISIITISPTPGHTFKLFHFSLSHPCHALHLTAKVYVSFFYHNHSSILDSSSFEFFLLSLKLIIFNNYCTFVYKPNRLVFSFKFNYVHNVKYL